MGGRWRLDLWSALVGSVLTIVGLVVLALLRRPAVGFFRGLQRRARNMHRRLASGVEGRYREEVIQAFQNQHLGAGAASLDQIFVSPRFLKPLPEPDHVQGNILPRTQLPYLWPELAARVAIEPPATMTLGQLVGSVQRAAVIGSAGGGKSTALAYLAIACADPRRFQFQSFKPGTLPLHAHLAELQLSTGNDGRASPVERPLLSAIQRRARTLTTDRLPGLLQVTLREGRAVVLLDGWDELASSERAPYTRWISELMTRFPDNQYVVSAPLAGQGSLLELGFVPLILQNWDMADATKLAGRWASAVKITLPTVRERQRSGAAQIPALDFWQAGMTPLDATLNLWLMLAGEDSPLRAASRFGAGIHHLLAPFAEGTVNWPLEVGHQVLGSLAHRLERAETRIASHAQLEEIVHLILSEREVAGGRAAQECLKILGTLGGLLVPCGGELYVFRSPAMFDYFWAYQAAAAQDGTQALARWQNPEWSNALRFYTEMADAGPLVQSALAAPPDLLQESLFRAAEWISGATAQEKWIRPILIRLGKLMIDGRTPLALRERAAAALVGTRDDGVGYLLRQAVSAVDPVLRAIAMPGLGALATELPGKSGDGKAMEALIRGLDDESVDVQAAAVHALSATRSEVSEQALIRTLLDAAPDLRQVTAEAMARIGEVGYQIIRGALESEEILVRRAAVAGIANVVDSWADEKLDHLQRNDPEWIVRSAAEDALKHRQQQAELPPIAAVQADQLAWLVRWAADRGEGVPGGPAATATLQRLLEEGEPDTARAAAARSLGDLGQQRFVRPLKSALRDSSPLVRDAALYALAVLSRSWNQRLAIGPGQGEES